MLSFSQLSHERSRIGTCLVLAWLLAIAPIAAAAGQRSGQDQSSQKSDKPDEVDTENLFGFTEGTDVGKKGEQDVIVDTIGRFSKRRAGPGASGYTAVQPVISYQYDPTDNLSIEPGLYFDARDSRNIAGVPDKAFATFNGGSLELKYQFFKRTEERPFSLSIQTEPQYARITPIEGQGADVFSVDTRLMADVRLVPDKLWAGFNLIYDPSVAHLKGSGEVDKSSTLTVSGSLMMQVAQGVFIGPEMRYLRAYDGTYLNRFLGYAVFVGPVLHYQVKEKGFVTLAYSAQVFGHDRDPDLTDRAFYLNQAPRHALRLRFGLVF